ncbi:MAG: diaminobutyrate acetyltransferase [Ruegeria sp.]|nr:diaminobutyrate acetyltransferase [Ruegeria sp.]
MEAVISMRHAREFSRKASPVLRKPEAADGPRVWDLVRSCKPLDENSMYCNLIQCDHFRDTCVVAELNDDVVGWVSAYILPHDLDTVFVWQVAVSEKARGTGLGSMMLSSLLRRDACRDIKSLQTTITRDNLASWALFRKFSQTRGAVLKSQAHFTQTQHFRDRQSTEYMVTIDLPEATRLAA